MSKKDLIEIMLQKKEFVEQCGTKTSCMRRKGVLLLDINVKYALRVSFLKFIESPVGLSTTAFIDHASPAE